MLKFVKLNCLTNSLDTESFSSDAVQSVRHTLIAPDLIAPLVYKPILLEALQQLNFQFHRTTSFHNLIQDCNACEGETFLMYWGSERSDSRVNMSVSVSSCSSGVIAVVEVKHEKELCSTAQQTDISCRYIFPTGIASPGNCPGFNAQEGEGQFRSRIGDLTFSSPASSLLHSRDRSMSILGSVCALLLNKQQNAASPKEVSSLTGSAMSENICRICFGGESAERLVRPCSCRGTIAAVHRACLERWLLQAATSHCELCRHHYIVTRTHKWSWMVSLAQWAVSGRGRALAADLWRGVALGAASVLGTARALHACDVVLQAGARRGGGAALAANLFSSLLIGVIGALNGLLTTWMLLKIQEHQASWQSWRDSTLHVHVTLDDESVGSISTVLVAQDSFTAERGTNVIDPFMAALPFDLSEL